VKPEGISKGPAIEWTARDLRMALLRRAHFTRAGDRWRRSGNALAHAGVSRRVVRRLGLRAASSLVRGGNPALASALLTRLSSGFYHDEQTLAFEILDRLADVWPDWAVDVVAMLSRGLRHPWDADRLAQIQSRLLSRNPALITKHLHWAASQNPLRRRAAALALLSHRCHRPSRGVRVARAVPILRILMNDPEPHPLVQAAVGRALAYYAVRAPRSVARLLQDRRADMSHQSFDRARRLIEAAQAC
jgi:hypothetical protein